MKIWYDEHLNSKSKSIHFQCMEWTYCIRPPWGMINIGSLSNHQSLLVLVLLHQMNNPSGWNAWFLYKCHGFKSNNVCLRVKRCLIFTHITILIVCVWGLRCVWYYPYNYTYRLWRKICPLFLKESERNKDRQRCIAKHWVILSFFEALVDTNVWLRNLYYSKI